MSQENLLYSESHEWIKDNGDGTVTIGITDHAQDSLGDIVFVELPDLGDSFEIEDEFGVVESVKAASDLYMPVAGSIVATNSELEDEPEIINEDPYDKGWMIKVKLADAGDLDKLLNLEQYQEVVDAEA
ncbi:MAG TPA: glycine cleavage system protein GcvH [Trueperaceae bacterium]|nr:glycine cleavage system protein GcvH [Trueperaceae bacterium]